MSNRKEYISAKVVNNFERVHPALFYLSSLSITTICCQIEREYIEREKVKKEFKDGFYTIINNIKDNTVEDFIFSNDELANRSLYYPGKLDIVKSGWSYDDILKFKDERLSDHIVDVFNIIRNEFFYYIDTGTGEEAEAIYDLLACFVIYTYFHPLFHHASILHFWGNAGTGKTKICSLIDAMCFNPINSANISAATLYRIIEGSRATVILDESEDMMTSDKGREIINLLLAGTGKSGEVFRQEKSNNETFSTTRFRVFSPKIIANIGGIDRSSILSRSIRITTLGSKDQIILNRNVETESEAWQNIRNKLYRTCLSRFQEVVNSRDNLPEHNLSGRVLDNWIGLLSVANLCGKAVYEHLVNYAIDNDKNIKVDIDIQEEDQTEVKEKLKELCNSNLVYRATPEELVNLLIPHYGQISKKALHAKLTRLGVKAGRTTINGKTQRFYEIYKDKL